MANDRFGNAISNKLMPWRDSLDNLRLSEIRREIGSLGSHHETSFRRAICCLVSKENIFL